MSLTIENAEVERLARELAAQTGETVTEAVLRSLRERLLRERGRVSGAELVEDLRQLGEYCSRLPVLDARSPDDILGYDASGLPH